MSRGGDSSKSDQMGGYQWERGMIDTDPSIVTGTSGNWNRKQNILQISKDALECGTPAP